MGEREWKRSDRGREGKGQGRRGRRKKIGKEGKCMNKHTKNHLFI